jgi:hypothetical protein
MVIVDGQIHRHPDKRGRVSKRRHIGKAIRVGFALGVALSAASLVTRAKADDVPPAWAYAVNPPDFKCSLTMVCRGMFRTAPPRSQ